MKKLFGIAVIISSALMQGYALTTSQVTPSASGAYSGWKSSIASFNYMAVDESICNGDVDYVVSTTTGARDSYKISLAAVPSEALINEVTVYPCSSSLSTVGTSTMALSYRINGVDGAIGTTYVVTGTSSLNRTPTRFTFPSFAKKSTSTLEVGVINKGGQGIRVSRLAATIGYTVLPPSAPTNLLATAIATTSGGFVNLTWKDNANNETYYIVDRSTNGTTYTSIAVLGANAASYKTSLLGAGTYYFRVRSYNSTGYSAYSNVAQVAVVPILTTPLAPSMLATTYASGTGIIYWNDNSSNEAGFILERSSSGGVFSTYTTLAANEPYYLENETVPGTYSYRVKAFNQAGSSAYSNTATYVVVAQLPPSAPEAVMVSLASSTPTDVLPILTWTDTANNETGFSVERKVGVNGTFSQVGTLPSNTTYFIDYTANQEFNSYPKNGEAFSHFMYRIVATNEAGQSVSQEVLSNPLFDLEVKNAPSYMRVSLASSTPTTLLPQISWGDASTNEEKFIIERKVGVSGVFAYVGEVGANVTSFTDFTANDAYNQDRVVGATFMYRVTAYNRYGSRTSVEVLVSPVSELTPNPAPSGLMVTVYASSTPSVFVPVLSWTDVSSNEANFVIERKDGLSGEFKVIGVTPENFTFFYDIKASDAYNADPINITSFTYRVSAVNNFGTVTSGDVWFFPSSF